MKISLVVPNLGAGGAERVVTTLAHAWVSADPRSEVTIVTLDRRWDDFYELDPRVKRHTLGGEPEQVQTSRDRIARVMPLRRFLEAERPDVIVSFITVTNLVSIVAASGTKIPVIVSERIDPREHRIGGAERIVRDVLYRRAAALVVLTEGVAAWARKRSKHVHVIPNFARRAGHSRPAGGLGRRTVVAMGRLTEQKGFDMLLDAFAACARTREGWTLQILGEGPDRAALLDRAKQLGISERVEMPGVVPDPDRWLARAEIFALSSRYEGFPHALSEAMAGAVPAVAFDCPTGPSELIRPEVDGLLVPPRDVGAFADALGRLMDDPDLRERLAARAPEVTDRFSVDRVVGIWTDLVTEVAAGSRPS